ncbi:hypothetical protein [Halomonas stenophila]|uniref:Uncharacterized protein n=1 Tax=Halomonas stenophila TaxID=795312 RepID=A0A7W5HLY2_9GAMM|nr:hypothetical protein [Halomonas stenophila]MBB3232106.1 hypothetical protein [Halomonas stenophila]
MRYLPPHVEIFTGQAPQPRELQRFHARHGYAQEGVNLEDKEG